jgi:hypothetical protein
MLCAWVNVLEVAKANFAGLVQPKQHRRRYTLWRLDVTGIRRHGNDDAAKGCGNEKCRDSADRNGAIKLTGGRLPARSVESTHGLRADSRRSPVSSSSAGYTKVLVWSCCASKTASCAWFMGAAES